jgi:hypothetical protein
MLRDLIKYLFVGEKKEVMRCVFAYDQRVILIVIMDASNGSRLVYPMVTNCNHQI